MKKKQKSKIGYWTLIYSERRISLRELARVIENTVTRLSVVKAKVSALLH